MLSLPNAEVVGRGVGGCNGGAGVDTDFLCLFWGLGSFINNFFSNQSGITCDPIAALLLVGIDGFLLGIRDVAAGDVLRPV